MEIADKIEKLRMEIYQEKDISDKWDKHKIDDLLFEVQSKLRFDIIEIVESYEN